MSKGKMQIIIVRKKSDNEEIMAKSKFRNDSARHQFFTLSVLPCNNGVKAFHEPPINFKFSNLKV